MSRGRGQKEKGKCESKSNFGIFSIYFSSPVSGLSRNPSLPVSLIGHAFLSSLDAEARALRHVVGCVASLVCDSSATKNGDNDDDDAATLAFIINPIDVATFSAPSHLLVLLLVGVHLGLRGCPEGIRSNDARLRRREQLAVELLEEKRQSSEKEVRLGQKTTSNSTSFSFPKTKKSFQMMRLQRGFPDFDLDGKEIYLDKVRGECFSFGIGERGGEENRGRDVFLVLFAHRLSLLFSLFPSSLSVVSPPPPAPQYSARWPLREDAHLRYQDAPVRGRGGEGVAAPGERGVETCFLSFSALFPPCRCLFSLFFSDLETFPQKIQKQNKIQLNIQLLEAGLSVDTLQEG